MLTIANLEIELKDFKLESPGEIEIKAGDKALVTGRNGAGKSVFLYAVADLVRNRKGEVKINGKTNRSEGWQGNVGAYLDRYFLIPYLTPREHLKYMEMVKQVSGEEMNDFVLEAIDRLDFDISGKKEIRELSEGNQKKLGLISSLVGSPALLVWDEPFANLDDGSREGLVGLQKSLQEQTILYSEHLPPSGFVCDRRLHIEAGRLGEIGPPF